jgi:hypothetical protein
MRPDSYRDYTIMKGDASWKRGITWTEEANRLAKDLCKLDCWRSNKRVYKHHAFVVKSATIGSSGLTLRVLRSGKVSAFRTNIDDPFRPTPITLEEMFELLPKETADILLFHLDLLVPEKK